MSAASTAFAPGHTDSVLCCQPLAGLKLLASGGEDGAICLTDLATLKPAGRVEQSLGEAVPSLCSHPAEEHTLFAAAGTSVLQLDLRRSLDASAACRCFSVNAEEVNSVAATASNGGWLAAGDDSGEVQVISLAPSPGAAAADAEAASATAPLQPSRPAAYKTLRRGHANICAAVVFRPHRPWELLSGGLDSRVVRWDFSRLRAVQSWGMDAEATASGGQVFNPPMVHCLAVPQTEERGLCRLMAVGRGDGCVAVYDADHKPAAAASSGGGGGSGSKKGSGKAGARQRGGAAQRQAASVPGVPGRLARLGPEQGGHTAAVNSVAFFPGGSSWQQLLSGGNDCRLLLWNWGAAQAAAQAEAEAGEERAEEQEAAAAAAGQEAEAAGGSLLQGGPQQPSGSTVQGSSEAAVPLLAAKHRHARKINWACAADVPGCPHNVFVADTGRRLTGLTLS